MAAVTPTTHSPRTGRSSMSTGGRSSHAKASDHAVILDGVIPGPTPVHPLGGQAPGPLTSNVELAPDTGRMADRTLCQARAAGAYSQWLLWGVKPIPAGAPSHLSAAAAVVAPAQPTNTVTSAAATARRQGNFIS
jgi:hypothetical protein